MVLEKKEINIKNIEMEFYSCFQSVVATVAQYYNQEFPLVALGRLGFEYGEELPTESLGEKIDPYSYRKIIHYWNFLGINKLEFEIGENSEEAMIHHLNSGHPIVVYADLFDCPWNQAYKKYTFSHCYLLSGYDKKSTEYYFKAQDPYFKEENITQTFCQIKDIAKVANILEINRKKETGNLFKEIEADSEYYFAMNTGKNILQFASALEKTDLKKESGYPEKEIYAIPLLDNLRIVGDQRKAYAVMLDYLNRKYEIDIQEVVDGLSQCHEEWRRVRMLLMKKIVSSKSCYQMNSVAELLYKIAQKESETMRRLNRTLKECKW